MSRSLRLALAAFALAALAATPGHARTGEPAGRGHASDPAVRVEPSPNPLHDHGTLRVTAGLVAGARAGNPARVIGLPGEVTLVDMTGRVIRTLWRGTLDRLTFEVPFTARDDQDRAIPPGLYFVVVRTGEHRSISRVAVVR